MALTAYCKKCDREVEAAEVCPYCGSKLGKNAAHVAWCVERTPALDWMCWNAVMRLLLPAALLVLLLVLLLEGISGGMEAVERLMTSGFPAVLGILLATILAMVLAVLILQGKELADYVIDNRGIHEVHYLPNPTPLKLLARLKSPALLSKLPNGESTPVIKLREVDLPWREVARVQLWPEKCMVLYYAPAWWLRIPVMCTPFTWDDALAFTREKLGKKRKIQLPPSLVIAAPPKVRKAKPQAAPTPEVAEALEQLRMEERMEQQMEQEKELARFPEEVYNDPS